MTDKHTFVDGDDGVAFMCSKCGLAVAYNTYGGNSDCDIMRFENGNVVKYDEEPDCTSRFKN